MDTFPFTTAPDWGLTDNIEAEVEEQVLGDGYRLRRPKGINYLRESWTPSWGFLGRQESINMYQWLKARLSVTPFYWQHPETLETVKVICSNVARVSSDVGIYSLKATFVQDFNL